MSAQRRPVFGMTDDQEVNPERLGVNIDPIGIRLAKWLSVPSNMVVTLLMIAGAAWFYEAVGDLLLVATLPLALFALSRRESTPLKMPVQAAIPDPNEPDPKTGAPSIGEGIFYLGNDAVTGKEIWITNSDARQHFLVLGTTGAGKAIDCDRPVHTPTGWRRIGDLRVGDRVTTPEGGSAAAIGVYPQGEIDVCRLTFADGRILDGACPDHLWEVHHKHWRGKHRPGVSRAGEVRPRLLSTAELGRLLETNSNGVFAVPLPAPVEKPLADLPIDPYALGAWLGDGHIAHSVGFAGVEGHTSERASRCLRPIGMEPKAQDERHVRFSVRQTARGAGGPGVKSPLRSALEGFGLYGCLSHEKFIPQIYKESSISQRWALVAGLMDTNGTCDRRKPAITFCSTSERLARDLQEIVWSLGGIAKISPPRRSWHTHNGEKRPGRPFYQVSMRHPDPSLFFTLPRKVALAKRPCQRASRLRLGVTKVEMAVRRAEGVCILVDHPSHLFVAENYVVTHNTESLIGFAANALTWGSGLLFCDGKGDVSLFAKMFAMARRFGREDDLLVLNFMTGSRDVNDGSGGGGVLSNTLNPFSTGSSDYLTQMVVSLMDEVGGDGAMWKGRATAMLSGVIKALVFLRDRGHLDLNVGVIRDHMQLKRIIALADPKECPDISPEIREVIRAYLTSLPGYQESKKEAQAQTTLDQHGYLEMQFTKIFGSLASVYKHIFYTPYGQVDMMDVVLNRRILVVMLPALEMSSDELENLGKIVVANLKGMMGATLGSRLEGNWQRVVNNRPTNSPSPFLCILDEVGYYTVDGLALMAAQARSLGFSMVYASQDIPAMKRRNEKEAASIIANTNTKIFMRTEEMGETAKLAVDSADKGTRVRLQGFERRIGEVTSSYAMEKGTSYEEVNRISASDLKAQEAGEMHVLFKRKVVRAKSFYADPVSALDRNKLRLRPNHFVEVARPSIADVEDSATRPLVVERLMSAANAAAMAEDARAAAQGVEEAYAASDDIAIAAVVFERMLGNRSQPAHAACGAIGDLANKLRGAAEGFASQVGAARAAPPPQPVFPARPGEIEEFDADDLDDMGDASGRARAARGFAGGLAASERGRGGFGGAIGEPMPPVSPRAPSAAATGVNRAVRHEVQVDGGPPIPVANTPATNDELLRTLAALNFGDDDSEDDVDRAIAAIAGSSARERSAATPSPPEIRAAVDGFARSIDAAEVEGPPGEATAAPSGGPPPEAAVAAAPAPPLAGEGEAASLSDFLEELLADPDDGDAGGRAR